MKIISSKSIEDISILTTQLFNFIDELPSASIKDPISKVHHLQFINSIREKCGLLRRKTSPIGGQAMKEEIKIRISEEDILILKTDMLLKQCDFEKIRADVSAQIKTGVVTIPNGFSYEVIKNKESNNWRESMMRDFLQESER